MNRVEYVKGKLDEVVTDGGAHLEHMGGKRWFLSMWRADGSEFCVWFHGTIAMTEERDPPKRLQPRPRDEQHDAGSGNAPEEPDGPV